MATGSSSVYEPLDLTKNEIRILRLKPLQHNRDHNEPEQKIICSLEHKSLDDAVEYKALSYVWENGHGSQEVLLSGIERSVSANLVDALRQLRLESDDVILWADQLCINQEDHLEKASQIQKMKSVFQRASKVIAWLGGPADDSDLVFITLRQIERYRTLSLRSDIFGDIAGELRQKFGSSGSQQAWDQDKILVTLRTALPAFAARRYWTRLWVLQEYVLAREVLVLCGSSSMTDTTLGYSWRMLEHMTTPRGHLARRNDSSLAPIYAIAWTWRRDAGWWDAWLRVQRLIFQRENYISRHAAECDDYFIHNALFMVMYRTLTTFSGQVRMGCSDPRDRIFSLLGLATDPDSFQHFPDYTKGVEESYEELARNFIQQGYIDTLSMCQEEPAHRARNMASWAADWSLKIRITLWGKLDINASKRWRKTLAPSFPDYKTILVSGTLVDTIHSHGSQWAHSRPLTRRQMHTFLSQIQAFCDQSPLIPANEKDSACAKIAAPAAITQLRYMDSVLEEYKQIRDEMAEQSKIPIEPEPDPDTQHDPETNVPMSSAYEKELRLQLYRCPFITTEGYVGIAPPYVREGDCICIFPGGKTPYVLRREEGGEKYSVVGAGHVYGIMNGEFFHTIRNVRSFALV